jgi:hypothetical protein
VRWSTRPHGCLYTDTWRILGSGMFDRCIAMFAEVNLGALLARTSEVHLRNVGLPNSACLAGWCSLPIVVAQGCCWCGVITDNKIWHVAEESLWGAAFAMHCFLATFGWLHAIRPGQSKQVEAAASAARMYLLPLGIFTVPYVHFMFSVDVPMYYEQWVADEVRQTAYDSFSAGLTRLLTCNSVADDWAGWADDMNWMRLYFTIGPVAAILVAHSLRGVEFAISAAKEAAQAKKQSSRGERPQLVERPLGERPRRFAWLDAVILEQWASFQ